MILQMQTIHWKYKGKHGQMDPHVETQAWVSILKLFYRHYNQSISTRPPLAEKFSWREGKVLNVPAQLAGTFHQHLKDIIIIFHIGQVKGSLGYII